MRKYSAWAICLAVLWCISVAALGGGWGETSGYETKRLICTLSASGVTLIPLFIWLNIALWKEEYEKEIRQEVR